MLFICRWLLSIGSAVLLGAYANYPALAFLPYIALVPWIVLYTDPRKGKVSWWYYFPAILLAWILQYPSIFNFGWYAPIGMGLFLFVMYLPFIPLLSWLHRKYSIPRTLLVPLVWVAVEFLRARWTLSHIDLYGLGASQARFPLLVQFADLTGSYGISFLVAAVNGFLADAWFHWRDCGWKISGLFQNKRLRLCALSLVVAFAGALTYGILRVSSIRITKGPVVAIVQPNIPHTQRNLVGVHLSQLLMTEEEVPEDLADLIIWPENAILDNLQRQGVYLEDLAWMAKEKNAYFLVGAQGKPKEYPGYMNNGAFFVDKTGTIRDVYYKRMLFPWSEFVPFDDFTHRYLPGLWRIHRALTRMAWGFMPTGRPGDRSVLFELPTRNGTVPFSTLICVENAYPPIPAEAGRMGARFLVNITSEGEVGGPVQEQLLRIAILRAIENRVSYVRCGNTGISGIIDPIGQVIAILRGANGGTINTPGVLIHDVPISEGKVPFFVVSRGLFGKAVVAVVLLMLVVSFFRKRRPGVTSSAAAGILALTLAVLCC